MLVEVAAVVDEAAAVVAVVVTVVAAVAVAVAAVDAAVDVPWTTVAVRAEEIVEGSRTWSFDAID